MVFWSSTRRPLWHSWRGTWRGMRVPKMPMISAAVTCSHSRQVPRQESHNIVPGILFGAFNGARERHMYISVEAHDVRPTHVRFQCQFQRVLDPFRGGFHRLKGSKFSLSSRFNPISPLGSDLCKSLRVF